MVMLGVVALAEGSTRLRKHISQPGARTHIDQSIVAAHWHTHTRILMAEQDAGTRAHEEALEMLAFSLETEADPSAMMAAMELWAALEPELPRVLAEIRSSSGRSPSQHAAAKMFVAMFEDLVRAA